MRLLFLLIIFTFTLLSFTVNAADDKPSSSLECPKAVEGCSGNTINNDCSIMACKAKGCNGNFSSGDCKTLKDLHGITCEFVPKKCGKKLPTKLITELPSQTTLSVYWQSNGGGCVPTDATIERNQYFTVTGAGRVKYKGNGTDPLIFSCPVNSINPNVLAGDGTILRLFYQDPDGPGEDFKVEATLRSFAKTNGVFTKEVCKVSSNKQGSWQEGIDVCHNIDLDANLYWVEVVVKRKKASNLVVEFNGVSLEGRIF